MFKGSSNSYKEDILNLAENQEEIDDLNELFASTEAFYAERNLIADSGKTPYDYMMDLYMANWRAENPNATKEEEKHAVQEYDQILSDGLISELDAFQKDDIDNISDDSIIEDSVQEGTDTNHNDHGSI